MSRLWPQAAMLVTVPNGTLSRKARKEYMYIGETYHMQFNTVELICGGGEWSSGYLWGE